MLSLNIVYVFIKYLHLVVMERWKAYGRMLSRLYLCTLVMFKFVTPIQPQPRGTAPVPAGDADNAALICCVRPVRQFAVPVRPAHHRRETTFFSTSHPCHNAKRNKIVPILTTITTIETYALAAMYNSKLDALTTALSRSVGAR